jgi:hypothetical protein
MFEVIEKETGVKFKVYAISDNSYTYPIFLVRKDGKWTYSLAELFVPIDEPIDKDIMSKWTEIKDYTNGEIIVLKGIQYAYMDGKFVPLINK